MKSRKWEPLALLIPTLLLITFVMVMQLILNMYYSVHDMDYMKNSGFVGLKYYKQFLSDPAFYKSLITTLFISIAAVALSMGLGTLMAVWIDKNDGFLAYIIQLVGLIPWAISMVVAGLLWKWIFNGEFGLMNYILSLLGIERINVFATPFTSILTVIFVMAWRTTGYSMVLILAGLKGVPQECIEAAQIDGAKDSQVFWRVKLPLIKTPLLISAIVITMSNFNNNTIPMVLTGGGPGNATSVLTFKMYQLGFEYFKFGEASALSVLILLINMILVVLYVRTVKYEI